MPIGQYAASEYHVQFWPKGEIPKGYHYRIIILTEAELVINQIGAYSLPELQGLSKASRAPFVMFTPRNGPSGPDANNMARYANMSGALARASNVSSGAASSRIQTANCNADGDDQHHTGSGVGDLCSPSGDRDRWRDTPTETDGSGLHGECW